MMEKQALYVKDGHEETLKELEVLAAEVTGEKLNALFDRLAVSELERIKEMKKAREGKVSKITVRYQDANGVKRKNSFVGRWIVKGYETPNVIFSVAITENDRLFVLIEDKRDDTGGHLVHEDFSDMEGTELWKHGSYPDELLARVAGEIGEEYEEILDI